MSFSLPEWQPSGITMIEASAGTGKTFTLASICVRGFAEGWLDPSGLCAVTFSEKAAAELKDRVRKQIESVLSAFGGAAAGEPPDPQHSTYSVFAALWEPVNDDERARRAENLTRALNDFDGVSISTIHGFCQRVLASLGQDLPADSVVNDLDEVTADLVLSRFSHIDDLPLGIEYLKEAAATRLASPDLELWPTNDAVDELTNAVSQEVHRRRNALGYRSFDDLLVSTRDAIIDPDLGPDLVADLRRRFRLVLIDEFQDTDKVQWDLFRTAFADRAHGSTVPVVLVGDPKQSIYRFRGAELSSYRHAKDFTEAQDGAVYELTTNYRSSPRFLTALNQLFGGVEFGPGAAFVPVAPSPNAEDPVGSAAPLEFRLTDDDTASPIGAAFDADLATVVLDLLSPADKQTGEVATPPSPSDIAILTRSNADADRVVETLRSVGVPATTSSGDSVLDSRAAREWLTLLRSLSNPSSLAWARTVAVGWFGPSTLDQLATFTDDEDRAALERCHDWATTLAIGGLPRLLTALRSSGLRQRLLSHVGGERDLTDVEHIAELMQHHTGGAPTRPEHLLTFLNDLAQTTEGRTTAELVERRVDRDDDTVQVMTIHKAKGLEFSIVLCAGMWRGTSNNPPKVRHAYLPELERRVIDSERLTGTKASETDLHPVIVEEELAESKRLIYVALTRAKHRAIVWWAPQYKGRFRAMKEILVHASNEDFEAWEADPDSSIEAVTVPPPETAPTRRWQPPATKPEPQSVATFTRTLDPVWGSWSFSRILRLGAVHGHDPLPPSPTEGTDHPAPGGTDEAEPAPDGPVVQPPSDNDSDSLLQRASGGVSFGLLVHSILEHSDFASDNLTDELAEQAGHYQRLHQLGLDPQELATGLSQAVNRPLGGPLGSFRLADLQRSDRLDELWFHLPAPRLAATAIAATINDHLTDDDPLRDWFTAAARGGLQVEIEGLLNGSIDLVGRTGDRYWLADYKTNRIANNATFSTAEMAGEMARHGYPLQAALYLLALHRFLRWRLPDYDPHHHLGGAAYLFVRGMAQPDAGRGVFWWNPPVNMVHALDELFTAPGGNR